MIDEQKLIEDLKAKIYPERFGERCNAMDVINGVLQVISEQPKTDWIPCEERLPSERDWYLAVFKEADTDYCLIPVIADYVGTVTNGTTEEGWCIAHCTDTGYPSDEYYKKLKCVAWTNLPQPYKKEGAE